MGKANAVNLFLGLSSLAFRVKSKFNRNRKNEAPLAFSKETLFLRNYQAFFKNNNKIIR